MPKFKNEEHRRKLSEALKRAHAKKAWVKKISRCKKCGSFWKEGHICNLERLKKQGFQKGHTPWWVKQGKEHPAKGLKHSQEARARISQKHKGHRNYNWIGGNWRYWHQLARKRMEKHLGRKLNRKEVVHHKNGEWFGEENNKIENLEVMSRAEHIKLHQIHKFSPVVRKGNTPWNKGLKLNERRHNGSKDK